MPNRTVKESVSRSDSLRRCSLMAALFWTTFLTVFDDHGCFDARTEIIKARLFPLRKDVTEDMIEDWLGEYERQDVAMIQLWVESNGVRFGQCLSFELHNDLLVKHAPTTPCPPWLRSLDGQDTRLASETKDAYLRIEAAIAKLSSTGSEPTYREIIRVANCSMSTLAKYRKHKAATACYTPLPGATDATPKNPIKSKKENLSKKEKPPSSAASSKAPVPDARRQALKDFIFQQLRSVGIEPVTDKSDWDQFEILLKNTRSLETLEPKEPFTLEKLKGYFRRFITSGDKFDQNQGHPIRFFCTNINRFMRENGNGSHSGSGVEVKAESPGSTSTRTTSTGKPIYVPKQR